MSLAQGLLNQILLAAQSRGMDQASLAKAAGLSRETISRAKKRGTIDLASIEALANVTGLSLSLSSASESSPAIEHPGATKASPLADPKWGLAWSNSAIASETLIRSALLKAGFAVLLEAVKAHGLEEVLRQWAVVGPTMKATPRAEVERKLKNIEMGIKHAEA